MRLIVCGIVGLIATTGWAQTTSAPAADQVWLAPSKSTESDSRWYPQSVTTLVGRVVELDSKQLAIQVVGDEVPTRVAAYRVIWIEPGNPSPTESAALKLYADGDYSGALRPLIDAVGGRPPVWRQQWLSMLAANAAWRSGRGEIALKLVSQLDDRPLAPYVLAWLPVAWEASRQRAAEVQAADNQLADKSPAVRLVAASWVMQSNRAAATATLNKLAVDTSRPFIARLAECVLWRSATPPEVTAQAPTWKKKLGLLPIVLQTGPTMTLVEKLDAASLNHDAEQLKLSLELTRAIPYPIQ